MTKCKNQVTNIWKSYNTYPYGTKNGNLDRKKNTR